MEKILQSVKSGPVSASAGHAFEKMPLLLTAPNAASHAALLSAPNPSGDAARLSKMLARVRLTGAEHGSRNAIHYLESALAFAQTMAERGDIIAIAKAVRRAWNYHGIGCSEIHDRANALFETALKSWQQKLSDDPSPEVLLSGKKAIAILKSKAGCRIPSDEELRAAASISESLQASRNCVQALEGANKILAEAAGKKEPEENSRKKTNLSRNYLFLKGVSNITNLVLNSIVVGVFTFLVTFSATWPSQQTGTTASENVKVESNDTSSQENEQVKKDTLVELTKAIDTVATKQGMQATDTLQVKKQEKNASLSGNARSKAMEIVKSQDDYLTRFKGFLPALQRARERVNHFGRQDIKVTDNFFCAVVVKESSADPNGPGVVSEGGLMQVTCGERGTIKLILEHCRSAFTKEEIEEIGTTTESEHKFLSKPENGMFVGGLWWKYLLDKHNGNIIYAANEYNTGYPHTNCTYSSIVSGLDRVFSTVNFISWLQETDEYGKLPPHSHAALHTMLLDAINGVQVEQMAAGSK